MTIIPKWNSDRKEWIIKLFVLLHHIKNQITTHINEEIKYDIINVREIEIKYTDCVKRGEKKQTCDLFIVYKKVSYLYHL